MPTLSPETVTEAFPDASRVPVTVGPSALMMKVTVPVGVPLPGGTAATLAVSVTVSPQTGAGGTKVTVVVVADWLTCWMVVPDELSDGSVELTKFAVTRWDPAARVESVTLAVPESGPVAVSVTGPRVGPPVMTKVTSPNGAVPAVMPETVAV